MKLSKKNISIVMLLLVSVLNGYSQADSKGTEYMKIADDFRQKSKPDSALVYYEKASAAFETEKDVAKWINAYNQIGIVLTRQDQYEKAKNYLNSAMAKGIETIADNSLLLATTYISLGVVYNALEDYKQSLNYHHKALSIRLSKLGENTADVATSYGNIGNVYFNSKDFEKAIDAHLKAKKIREKLFGDSSVEVIQSYTNLGRAYKEKKEYAKALDNFEKALNNKIKQVGEGHKDLEKFYTNISEVCFLMNNQKQGDFYKAKAKEVLKQ